MIETKPITIDRFVEGLQIYIHHRDNKAGQYRERNGFIQDTVIHIQLVHFDGDNPVQK